MFDFYGPQDYSFTFVKDGAVVGEFTADMRSAVVQAEEYRDANHPGALIFSKVTESKDCPVCNPSNADEEETDGE